MNAIQSKRAELRFKIYNDRGSGLHVPVCAVCGESIRHSFDLHEVIISRGDVAKCSEEVKLKIHCPENCVIVHPQCHIMAEYDHGEVACIRNLIAHCGYENIINWLKSLDDDLTAEMLALKTRMVNQVLSEYPER